MKYLREPCMGWTNVMAGCLILSVAVNVALIYYCSTNNGCPYYGP